ncbi:hypothetical protein NL676_028597 [Syzygium grande]|nr:hypothetical protein NL676_028597 [Syzygium grande]
MEVVKSGTRVRLSYTRLALGNFRESLELAWDCWNESGSNNIEQRASGCADPKLETELRLTPREPAQKKNSSLSFAKKLGGSVLVFVTFAKRSHVEDHGLTPDLGNTTLTHGRQEQHDTYQRPPKICRPRRHS